MLMPSIFGETFDDDFFGFPEDAFFGNYKNTNGLMQTDVEEMDQGYLVKMDLPGVKKEDVQAELKNGYLTISASANHHNEEKDKAGKLIRKERYSGSCSRTFFVGKNITQDDIKAKYENGVLTMMIPKKAEIPEVEKKTFIPIEG